MSTRIIIGILIVLGSGLATMSVLGIADPIPSLGIWVLVLVFGIAVLVPSTRETPTARPVNPGMLLLILGVVGILVYGIGFSQSSTPTGVQTDLVAKLKGP